jgi:hypothetical protein
MFVAVPSGQRGPVAYDKEGWDKIHRDVVEMQERGREEHEHEPTPRAPDDAPSYPSSVRAADSDGGGIAVIAAGILTIATLIISVTWWSGAGDTLRSVLEGSPLSGGVAKRATEDGDPLLVGAVLAALVLGILVSISVCRRRLATNVVRSGGSRVALLLVTAVRTLVLVFGVALVPVAASIAAGNDLEPGNEATVFSGIVPIAIVATGVIGFTLWSNGRCLKSAERRHP